MIHIINRYNAHLYGDILYKMHKLRHDIFVEQKGWEKLRREDNFEIDQFDNDDATYFLKIDAGDRILGGMRLRPTSKASQLGTMFRAMCEFEAPPFADNIWEMSRYFVADKSYRSKAGFPVFYELFFSVLEYAVSKGIIALSGFLEAITLPRLNALPWNVQYLGNIVTYGGTDGEPVGKGAPVRINVDQRMLKITKRMKRMSGEYCALPLGDAAPEPQKAYAPEVVFKFLEFLEQHPDQLDVLVCVARVFRDNRKGARVFTRDLVEQWLHEEHVAETMRGFTALAKTGHLAVQSTFLEQ